MSFIELCACRGFRDQKRHLANIDRNSLVMAARKRQRCYSDGTYFDFDVQPNDNSDG